MIRHTVYFSGQVQGVGFRFTVHQIAPSFAVTGHVRNLSDGRVELVAEGEEIELRAFIAKIRERMEGYIDLFDDQTSPATGEFKSFDIRR